MILTNIHKLYAVADKGELRKGGAEMRNACLTENAFVWLEGGRIKSLGSMSELPNIPQDEVVVDCEGRLVFPGFVDSHTHLVFATTREGEFVDRINGLSYEEIGKRGGGILNSAAKLRAMSEDELLEGAMARAGEIMQMGTTSVEIKSGYGLTVADELKMLRVAKRLDKESPLRIKTTLLGAHAFPAEYKENKDAYIDLVINEMIPKAVEEGLADYVDVFCERGYFSVEQTDRILEAGAKHGLKPKIHANQLDYSGGVQIGVKHNAISVDHLEHVGDEEIESLKSGSTIPTVLPSAAFFIREPYPPARKMIDAGLPVCIASDYNPGSTPTGNMSFEMALACINMQMLPEEALVASTLNGAAALEIADQCGSIEPGKAADLVITKPLDNIALIPYYFATNQIERVIINGAFV